MKELYIHNTEQLLNTFEIFIGLISTQIQRNSITGVHYSQQNVLFSKLVN